MAKNYAAFPQLREQKTVTQKYAREQYEMMTKDSTSRGRLNEGL